MVYITELEPLSIFLCRSIPDLRKVILSEIKRYETLYKAGNNALGDVFRSYLGKSPICRFVTTKINKTKNFITTFFQNVQIFKIKLKWISIKTRGLIVARWLIPDFKYYSCFFIS